MQADQRRHRRPVGGQRPARRRGPRRRPPVRDRLPARGQDRAGGDLAHGLLSDALRRPGRWRGRRCQHELRQCRLVLRPIGLLRPGDHVRDTGQDLLVTAGQRYIFEVAAPGTWRTTPMHRPARTGPAAAPAGSPARRRRVRGRRRRRVRGRPRSPGWPRAWDGAAARLGGGGPCADSRMPPYVVRRHSRCW